MTSGIRTIGNKTYLFCGTPQETNCDQFNDFYIEKRNNCNDNAYWLFVEMSEALPYLKEHLNDDTFFELLKNIREKLYE